MPWEEQRVNSTSDVFALLAELTDADAWACRGMSKSYEGKLISKIDRYKIKDDDHVNRLGLERHAMLRFLHAARSLVTPAELPLLDSIIPRMMLMQHYGAPTRLLDWTKSPWIGLYFACNCDFEVDGEIWLVNREQFVLMDAASNTSLRLRQDHAPMGVVPPLYIMLFAHKPEDWIVMLDPLGANTSWHIPHANPRIVSQQALFSMCGKLGVDHAEMIERHMGVSGQNKMKKIVIPASIKINCLKRLASMNITAASLFPGIDGLGKQVSDSLHFSFMQDSMRVTQFCKSESSLIAIEMPPV